MSSTGAVYFSRKPYTVSYMKDGEKKTIRRVPPPTLHEMLPTDIVTLTTKMSDDFAAGEEFTIKNINPRQPNTIQIANGEGQQTFVAYYDLELKEAVAPRHGVTAKESPENNRYLLWP